MPDVSCLFTIRLTGERLADCIDGHREHILSDWEAFAATLLPAAGGLDSAALRDPAAQILRTVAMDLATSRAKDAQAAKSRGEAVRAPHSPDTAAQMHAVLRAIAGFTMQQLVAEYRALRASVLRLLGDAYALGPEALADPMRFNGHRPGDCGVGRLLHERGRAPAQRLPGRARARSAGGPPSASLLIKVDVDLLVEAATGFVMTATTRTRAGHSTVMRNVGTTAA